MSLFITLFSTAVTATPINDQVNVGFKGSWQGKRFTNGSALIQQGIHLEVEHKWQDITTHIDLMDGRVWGSESTYKTNNDNFANLYEGYVRLPLGEFGGAKHTLTIGKQEVNLNDERFLSKGSWALNGRTFNAVVARGEWSSGYWHGGFLQLRSGGTYDGQCGTPQCETVSAGDVLLFANTNVKWNSLYIRPYLLHLRENATADNLGIERRITNTGFRVEGTHPNAFYTLDAAIQTGQASSTITHQAWMGVAELGLKKDRFKSSIYLEHNSGDKDPTDEIDQDFESFLGKYHGLRGWSEPTSEI